MDKKKRVIVAGVILAALAAIGTGVAVATGGDEKPLTRDAFERATTAALEHVGGGEVVETETGDDGSAYEVEIRTTDGTVVEVNLDSNFNVIASEQDDDGAGEKGDDEVTEGADDD